MEIYVGLKHPEKARRWGLRALFAPLGEFEGRSKGMRQWGTKLPSGYSCTGVGVLGSPAVTSSLSHPKQLKSSERLLRRSSHEGRGLIVQCIPHSSADSAPGRKQLPLAFSIVLALTFFAFVGNAKAAIETAPPPQIWSDKADYAPGETIAQEPTGRRATSFTSA